MCTFVGTDTQLYTYTGAGAYFTELIVRFLPWTYANTGTKVPCPQCSHLNVFTFGVTLSYLLTLRNFAYMNKASVDAVLCCFFLCGVFRGRPTGAWGM